jgi:transposase
MSKKERLRKCVVERVASGELLQVEAAVLLGVSVRQMKRIYGRYCLEGDVGLVHRSRGRRSSRSARPELRTQVLERYEQVYQGLGPTRASEKLAEEGLVIDHETLRRWLMAEGQWQRHRKRGQHRQRRPPKEHFGERVQLDGSHHAWYGEEHPRICLMNLVDDATSLSMTLMAEQETTEAARTLLQRWIERYGVPQALYTDRKNVYLPDRPPTLEEQLAGEEPMTAFGNACKKLGILILPANSPQAKGRVERKHGVYQDRPYHELRLSNITTIDATNRMLQNEFDDRLNQKFARTPRSKRNFHRPLPHRTDLRDVFCYEHTRVLANDWTIRYNGQVLQVLKLNTPRPKSQAKITVRQWLNGTLHLLYRECPLVFNVLPEPPPRQQRQPLPPKAPRVRTKPRYDHPWRGRVCTMQSKK